MREPNKQRQALRPFNESGLPRRRRQILLAVACGASYALAYCGFEQWLLGWVCFIPLLWVLDDSALPVRWAIALSWVAGMTAHLMGYTWIAGMLRNFGGLPLPLAVLGYVLLCLMQSTLFAAWGFGTFWLSQRLRVPIVWAAPVMMVVVEWLWPAIFPSYFADSQYRQLVLIQSADIWGVLGIGFLLTLCSAVLYQIAAVLIRKRGQIPLASGIAFVVLMVFDVVYGTAAISNVDDTVAVAPKKIRVGMVQTNMGIYDKTQRPSEGLRRHREQSLEVERQGAELIVWPESGYYYPLRDGVANVAGSVLGPISTPIIFGGLRVAEGEGGDRLVWNTAYLVDGGGNVLGTYDKTYLLAFGEYLPFGDWFPWLYDLSPNTSKFERGKHTKPLVLDGVKYGILICYEDIIPRFVNKVMESEPDVLVNITNDAWFGATKEPLIHLAMATFRSIENRRFMVRATNTGISAFVDPVGRILGETPVFARANSVHEVASLQGRTIYAVIGDALGWLALALVIFWMRPVLKTYYRRLRRLLGRITEPPEPSPSSEPDDRDASSGAQSSRSTPRRPRRAHRRR
jgi:apolipoprotein N-acyltransferase